MVNENEIICGVCGKEGSIGEGFDLDWSTDTSTNFPMAEIVCDKCGAKIVFDPLYFLDVDNIIYHSCDEDWAVDED